MKKNNIEDIFKKLCQNIAIKLDLSHIAPSKDMIIDLLQQVSYEISKADLDKLDLLDKPKNTFEYNLENLVQISIDKYSNTNNSFDILAQEQSEILNEFEIQTIDTKEIAKKFSDIQRHMTKQVKQANQTIEHLKKQVSVLKDSSELDFLTKTYNRRTLSRDLEKLCTINKKNDDAYLIMLDIDNFKKVNDTHGHVVGDKILIFLANTLKKILRNVNKVYRYGGEEFVILLNRTNKQECEHIANRILSTIRNSKLVYKDLNLGITISLGVTNITNSDLQDIVIDRADTALYKAKTNGKDQIVVLEDYEY